MVAKTGIRVAKAMGGFTLALLCLPHLSRVEAAQTEAPAADHHLDGVWDPLGGALFDPEARAQPGNKGRPMTELRLFPPYNPVFQARYDKITADLHAGVKIIDGSAKCLPQGMPRMMVVGYPIDISVQAKRVVMMFEPGAQRRIIYTDGRKHTASDVIDPTYSGESIGHWEGDTLIVDTVGLRDDLSFDYSFAPHSDALHVKERLRRVGDKLEDDMTLEDPKAFTGPWQIKRSYQLQPTWELKEYVCDEQ